MLSLCHASKPSGPGLTPIRLPPSWVVGPWLNAGHPAFRVGRQPALGLVQQGEFIAERVADARAAADRDVERRFDSLAAGAEEDRKRVLDIVNQNIGFRADTQVAHEFGVGVRKGEADRVFASPKHAMPKAVAIEGDRGVKVGDAKQEIVELSKQRAVGGHAFVKALALVLNGRRPDRCGLFRTVKIGERVGPSRPAGRNRLDKGKGTCH
jgi:hypothetical protein